MPPPPDSAIQFKPLLLLRSIVAVGVGFAVFHFARLGAVAVGWMDVVSGPSAALVPIAVMLLLLAMVTAGAIAGLLSGRGAGGHGLLLGLIVLVVLIVSTFSPGSVAPGWFYVVGAVVSLPMCFLGAELAGHRKYSS